MKLVPIVIGAVSRAVSEFKYGDVIEKQWIENALGISWPDSGNKKTYDAVMWAFFARFEEFREALLIEHCMALKSSRAGFWTIVLPNEQASHAVKCLTDDITKAIKKANKCIVHTDVSLLSDKGHRDRTDAIGRVSSIGSLSRSTLMPKRV